MFLRVSSPVVLNGDNGNRIAVPGGLPRSEGDDTSTTERSDTSTNAVQNNSEASFERSDTNITTLFRANGDTRSHRLTSQASSRLARCRDARYKDQPSPKGSSETRKEIVAMAVRPWTERLRIGRPSLVSPPMLHSRPIVSDP